MVKTTVYFDEVTAHQLRLMAADANKPQAEMIREAVREYVAARHQRPPNHFGMFSSGTGDLSRRRKELFAQIMDEKWERRRRQREEDAAGS